jgi:hypothetical protein
MASTYLTRTFGSATSRTKFTVSLWLKKTFIGAENHFFNGYNSANYRFMIYFDSSDRLKIRNVDNGSETTEYVSNAKYRDVHGWYHVVVRIDTSQAGGNRIKAYVNGEQITSWATSTEPNQGSDFSLGASSYSNILGSYAGTNHFWDGGISHYHYCDGQSYGPTEFGQTNATTGEWSIKASPSVTYGNQGFFMFDDDSSLTDKSGNGNNFTVGAGTLTKTEDNPSNVFATFNSLSGAETMAVNSTFANGNNKVTCGGTVYAPFGSTIGVNSGKYYAEFKIKSAAADGMIGIFAKNGTSNSQYLGNLAYQYCWYNDSGRIIGNNANIQTGVGQYTTNDIIGIALDCTNNKLYFHKNGTYITNGSGTGNPSSGTYGYSITDPASTDLGFYFMAAMDWGGSTRAIWEANFGNGYFGTTAVSSAGTNASNNGIFEYDVPTGYTALSTKGLNL